MPQRVVAASAVVALAFAGVASLLATPTTDLGASAPSGPELVRIDDHESGVHAYISPHRSFEGSSPINLLVAGNGSEVRRTLVDRTGPGWRSAEGEPGEGVGNGSADRPLQDLDPLAEWTGAAGSHRYAYVHDGANGSWVLPDAQLQDGDYFASRVHVRLYDSPHPEEEWVALQAHTEHMDWFSLRHRVDGVAEARRHVETDFLNQPGDADLHRILVGSAGYDHDGWVTVVELAVAPAAALAATRLPGFGPTARRSGSDPGSRLPGSGPAAGLREAASRRLSPADRRRLAAARARLEPRHAALAGLMGGLVLGVRAAGVLLERWVPGLHVYGVAALLYPVLAVGVPAAAFAVGRGLARRTDAGAAASLGLAAGVLADYAVLGVHVVPLAVVLHRAGLVAAVGLVAAGAAGREGPDRSLVLAGVALWVGLAAAGLAGWV